MPKVSVIFPMYNVAEYVKDSLSSVLDQTYKDFELIAVNDGATDATMDFVNEVLKNAGNDIPVKIIEKENGGLADARNAGLDHATGEYVVFIDSDDVIHPRYLEVMVADAERFHAELCVSTFKMVTKETLHAFEETVPGELIERAELMQLLLLRKTFVTGCWCLLVRRSLINDSNTRFNKNVRFSVDQAFIWKMIDLADSIVVNQSKLYHYYLRPGSIMTATKKADLYSGVDYFTDTVNSLQHLPFDKEVLLDRWKIGILHSSAKLTDYHDYKEVKEKLGVRYSRCLRIPDSKIKALCLLGMVSDKALYRVFRKK